jgi:NDP-sugar pyrophosphorylase family protein
MNTTTGIIAVGGRGVRFEQPRIQKCLFPVEGKPLLEYTLEAFAQVGIKTIFLLTGFHHEQVEEYLERRIGQAKIGVTTIFGGVSGQVPAILQLKSLIRKDFIYAGGDCIFPVKSLRSLADVAARETQSVAIMSTGRWNESLASHPRIELFPGTRRVRKIYNPADPNAPRLTGFGMYYMRPGIFKHLAHVSQNPAAPVCDFVQHANQNNEQVSVSITNDPWFCFHTKQDLEAWPESAMAKLIKKT